MDKNYQTALERIRQAAESGAETLDLTVLGLQTLPDELWELKHLKRLNLAFNQLTTFPPEIGRLSNITTLDLSGNQLSSLSPEIVKLIKLNEFYFEHNPLSNFPPEITQLANLIYLDLNHDQLTSLPPEIARLTNLKYLRLQNNQLISLPPEIGKLSHLTDLYLDSNKLISLPPEIGKLSNLTNLKLENNQLTSLPKEILSLKTLKWIYLHKTPLAVALPPELLGESVRGGDAKRILDFYRKLWSEGGQALREARVLVVGQPQVGKTSLVKRLKDNSFNPTEDSTMTVEMHTLPAGENTAQVWDFGGQEHMHATHPFFFSARCVYLLVINARDTEDQNRLEYWLRTITLYGKDSPIILIGNKVDKNQHTLDIPKKRLQKDYPNIKVIIETSAQDNTGIGELRSAIIQQVDSLPQVHDELPKSYIAVKKMLDEEKARENIISLDRYAELCEQNQVVGERDQTNLLAFMHDLGIVFHFTDKEGQPISEVGILNPNWVTQGVYQVINSKKVREETKGKLTLNMLKEILPKYKNHHQRLILELMKRFELCYQADESTFWLPNLMDKSEPDTGEWKNTLNFEYQYLELPENIITRFIVRTHRLIKDNQVWRTGVHLKKDGNQALINAKLYDKRITIQVAGRGNTRRDFLSFLRGYFDEIHQPFDSKPKAYVFHKDYPENPISFDELVIYENKNIDNKIEIINDEPVDLSVRELLNGYITPDERRKENNGGDTYVTNINIEGNVDGSNFLIGKGNKITQNLKKGKSQNRREKSRQNPK